MATPPREAIREFRVVTNHFSAEFGQASGVVVNVLTRSGSNTPRSRMFWMQQYGGLNARSWAAKHSGTDDPGLTQESVGGYWGGPIVKDRAFIFGTVERTAKHTFYINSSPVVPLFRPDDPTVIPFDVDFSRAQVRTDLHVTSTNVLTARYGYDTVTNGNAGRELQSAAERSRVLRTPVHELAVHDTHVFGSNLVHEMGAHWGWFRWFWTLDGFCSGCATVNYPSIKLGKPPGAPSTYANDRGDLADTLTWLLPGPLGRHMVKTGVNLSTLRLVDEFLPNMTGTYASFRADVPFDAANPLTYPRQFTQSLGTPNVPVRETIVSTFVQDEWRPADMLWLNLGVRWDHTRWPGPSSRRDDVAPRIGVSADPWKKGTTIVRAAAGRYYNESALQIARDVEVGLFALTIDNPGFQGDVRSFDPYGLNPNRIGPAIARYNVNQHADHTVTPYADQASVGLQQQIAGQIGVSIDVVRARGYRKPVGRDLNYPDSFTGVRPNPDKNLRQIIVTETRGESWYSGLQVGVQRRATARYGYSLAYTWSSSEDNTEGPKAFPQNQADLMAERGPVANDARHQFAATGTFSGPFGVRLGTVVYARSALPYNITTGADDNRDGVTNDRPAGVGRNSARGAALFQADVRVSKILRSGTRRMELLIEAFNVTNRVNLLEFNGNRSGSSFGLPASAGPPRQLQIGVRFDIDAARRP
jgi:hypothetical protein